ncbi:MAG: LysM peptidoglycan-binding domain-containing protein [Verrucomicrobia bacterium]|nr:LysM peptidoglycan-binding domain-containing protein [Verrucomicrobiota bacterium]
MNRPFILGLTGAVIVGAAIGLTYIVDSESGKEAAAVLKTPERSTGVPATAMSQSSISPLGKDASIKSPGSTGPAARQKPTFDVVRVNPRGDAVIAGRAIPNAAVTVRDGQKEVGSATADARGEWVVIPKQPLPTGSRELTLSSKLGDGTASQSDRNVVVVVPDRTAQNSADRKASRAPGALAVLVPREGRGDSIVIQKPSDGREALKGAVPVSIDAVDYDEAGNVTISGNAAPEAQLTIYIENRHAASGVSDRQGRWRVVPGGTLTPGIYTLRVDHLGPDGKVVGRAETQFTRAKLASTVPAKAVVFVEPGNSLWRIARRVYGMGIQYSVIFDANREQIRDPDMIYPGQVFFVPHVN